MRRAVAAAAGSQPHPNPRVGALLLTPNGDEIAVAHHEGPGEPHAEVTVLRAAGPAARGATLVTSLEPCNHHGRTPPCTEGIIAAGVSRVIVGAVDPDERVAGSGLRTLHAAGVEVTSDVETAAVIAADPGYYHHRRTGRARFRVKLAATLDGQVAAADGSSQWITAEEARRDGHRLRAAADAVMVGAETVRTDDPRLDVRLDDFTGGQPVPVVIAGTRPLPRSRRIYERSPLIYSADGAPVGPGIPSVAAGGSEGVDLALVAKDLADRGHLEVLVEGGPTLAAALVRAGLADELTIYLAGRLAGGLGKPMFPGRFQTLADSIEIEITAARPIGSDLRIDAALRRTAA